jgi:hypothetical protein
MKDEFENKILNPSENKMPWIGDGDVKIEIKRAIAGLGNAGETVTVSQRVAMNFVAQGWATLIIDKEKSDG